MPSETIGLVVLVAALLACVIVIGRMLLKQSKVPDDGFVYSWHDRENWQE